MEVRITKAMHEACRHYLFGDMDQDGHALRYHQYYDLDLAKFTSGTLVGLQNEVALHFDVSGAKTLHRDIGVWVEANANPLGLRVARARTVRQACGMLIEYIRRTPHKHLYSREQEGEDGRLLAYYVEKVEFTPAEKRKDYFHAEYITVYLFYEVFGVIQKTSFNLHRDACLALTPHLILAGAGWLPETPTLRADYERSLDKFSQIKDVVGLQCLASGTADDDGIDGNDDDGGRWYRRNNQTEYRLDRDGGPARVVIDVFQEEDKKHKDRDSHYSVYFWSHQKNLTFSETGESEWAGDEEGAEEDLAALNDVEIPIHPYVATFDLKRHKRLRVHVDNLRVYKYDKEIRSKLILPQDHSRVLDVLLGGTKLEFRDVVSGKGGGKIILAQGPPGVGKTLTAEIYSEYLERPLYSVQCSQLGLKPEDLEDGLMKAFGRGKRWNAVMLLDEADVYVHQRGNNLVQNAIVGVFLRTLEYYSGVIFLTTNRGDLVDDAILSRCTARIPYTIPSRSDQILIWRVLADANEINLNLSDIKEIVDANPGLSGRDVKNLLKLAGMVAAARGVRIDVGVIAEVKAFKPTYDGAMPDAKTRTANRPGAD